MVVLGRDDVGLPWSRSESSQALLGGPVPEATPWDQIARGADSGSGVLAPLECLAAQGELIDQDDTPVRIWSLSDEHSQAQAHAEAQGVSRSTDRTGMDPTAWVVREGEQTLSGSDAGRSHAGENRKALLTTREAARDTPLVMSEALSSHAADETTLRRGHGLAHGRRTCSEREEVFPDACQVVIESLQQVLDHDEEARVKPRSTEERFASPQASRRPIMEALKPWLGQQSADRLVEPNSSRGTAIASLLGHWETVPRFGSVPGAPLAHNLVERALKRCRRQRKHARCFATEPRASIASMLTSLMATCLLRGCQGPGVSGGTAGAALSGLARPGGVAAVDLSGQPEPP